VRSDLQVGDRATVVRRIEAEDLEAFAHLSLDRNRIHFDTEFASSSYFGKPIAHGMIGAALISGALTELRGDGNIWINASIEFNNPIFIGDQLKATLEITDIDRRGVASISVVICNDTDKTVIGGMVKSMRARI